MEQIIEEILNDLYALDKDLIQYDKSLKKAIEKIIKAKPDIELDENFKLKLRTELMEKAKQLQVSAKLKVTLADKTKLLFEKLAVVFGQFSRTRWSYVLPMLILAVGVAFFAQKQYQKNGGIYLTKQNVSFALMPDKSDVAGIRPDAGFVLKASKDLPEATIKKTVNFKPSVDFSVTKVKKTAMLALPALAADQAGVQDLPYQYEIKPTGELEKGKIYQVAIANGQIADRDYQWAFQVKAPFGVTETLPAQKATNVPTDSGIEIQFNRNLPEGSEKYFEILPKVEGALEIKMDRLYFKPQKLENLKVYKVTIKKDLISKDDGEILKEDYVFSFEAKDIENKASFEQRTGISVSRRVFEATTQMQPMLEFYTTNNYDNLDDKARRSYDDWLGKMSNEAQVEVYKLDGAQEFMDSYSASQDWALTWSSLGSKKSLTDFKPNENKKILSVKKETGVTGYNDIFQLPENLADGYYFFEIQRNNGKAKFSDYGWIVVSKVAQYASLLGNTGLVWAYDFEVQKPLEQAEISFIDQHKNSQSLGKLDAEGLLKFDLPEALKNNPDEDNLDYGPQFFKLAGADFEKVLVANAEFNAIKTQHRYWEKLTIDKTKYHPTDKLNFWGVLKNRRGEDLSSQKLSIGIFDCNDGAIYGAPAFISKSPMLSQEVGISKFDTVTGNFQFSELPVGYYCLDVYNRESKEAFSQTVFEIANYQKPAYRLETKVEQDAVYAGQEVTVKVKASFYDGTPVPGLKLNYTARDQKQYNNNLNYDQLVAGAAIAEKSGELVLDENGVGKLTYKTLLNKKAILIKDTCEFEFRPSLAEEAEIETFWTYVDVFNSAIGIKIKNQEVEKDKFELAVDAFELDLQKKTKALQTTADMRSADTYDFDEYIQGPKPGQEIEAKLIRIWQERIEAGQSYDYIGKKQEKTYNYEAREEIIEKFEGKTDQAGQWKFSKEIKFQDPTDSYKLIFSGTDGQGRKFEIEEYLAYGANEYVHVSLDINKDTFSAGEKVQLKVGASLSEDDSLDGKTLFYRYQADIEEATIRNGKTFEEEFSEKFAPSVGYFGVILTKYGFQETSSVFANFDPKAKNLDLQIIPEKENYRPGEEVKAQVMLKDAEGKPVSTQVNVAVTDEALFVQDSQSSGNLLDDLYATNYYRVSPVTAYTEYLARLNDMGGGGGGGEPRGLFMDIPYCENLETDAEGKAQIVFKLPDNLTGWVINARAFDTKKMAAGQAQKVISAGLPFFVDTVLNENYLTGDNPQIKMRFFGQEYQAEKPVDYAVKIKDLNFEQKASITSSVAYVSLGALPVGEYEIEISARQGEQEDKLIRKISVRDNYFSKSEIVSYDLSENLKNIKTGPNNFVELVFTDKGKGKFFGFLNDLVETGGSRLDQAVSAFLAEKLLTEIYYQQKFKKDLNLSDFYGQLEGDDSEKIGLSLFGGYGEPSLENSVKVADAISNATDKNNLKSYFSKTLIESRADIHRISKSLYGLSALGEPVLNKINSVRAYEGELALDDKIYLALALAKQGDLESARSYYETEIKKALKIENEQAWLEAGNIPIENEKLTATLGILTSRLNERVVTEKLWNYLEKHNPQKDLNILEKVLIVEDQLAKMPVQQASFELKTDKRNEKIILGNDQRVRLRLSKDEFDSLSFSNLEGAVQVLSIFEDPQTQSLQNDSNFEVVRSYEVENKKSQSFKEGDLVKVRLAVKLKEGASGDNYQLRDILPSGLRAVSYMGEDWFWVVQNEEDHCDRTWYPEEIDGNKVYFSFNKKIDVIEHRCANFTINYLARVISKGNFKADHAMLQSVENLEKYFVTSADQVEIK